MLLIVIRKYRQLEGYTQSKIKYITSRNYTSAECYYLHVVSI